MGIEGITNHYEALQETVAGPEQSAEDQQAFEDLLMEQRQMFLDAANGDENEANHRLTKWIANQLPADIKRAVTEQRHREQDALHNRLSEEQDHLLHEREAIDKKNAA